MLTSSAILHTSTCPSLSTSQLPAPPPTLFPLESFRYPPPLAVTFTPFAPFPSGRRKTRFVRGREGGAREVREMERDVPELPEVICERMERGRRVRRGFEVIEGLEGPPSEKVIRLNPPSAAFASVSEREDREGANARGTKETTLSLFQRPYRTLGWKAQSSSWAGSVNERERGRAFLKVESDKRYRQ